MPERCPICDTELEAHYHCPTCVRRVLEDIHARQITMLKGAIEGWRKTVADRDTRIAELEGIVAKLPKTKDGVVVTPGMELWWLSRGRIGECRDNVGYMNPDFSMFFRDCYSTPEAAEAAKEASND